MDDEKNKYKIIFLGDQSVGKSSIINRYCRDSFEETYQATIGLDFQSKNNIVNETNIRLLLYDTAGQEKYKSLIPLYIRDADFIIVVYDITVGLSFTHCSSWINEANNHKKQDATFFLVGNKSDLKTNRQVSIQHGEEFSKEKDFSFIEVSAKTGEGIKELFENSIVTKIAHKMNLIDEEGKEKSNPNPNGKMKLEIEDKKKKGCCS